MNLGGTLVPGTYQAVGALLGGSFFLADAGSACVARSSPSPISLVFRIAATTNPLIFDYEASEGQPTDLAGGFINVGSERGQVQLTSDGKSLSFTQVTCSDAGTFYSWQLTREPRAFIAGDSGIYIDCCRSTIPDAGSPVTDSNSYMLKFVPR